MSKMKLLLSSVITLCLVYAVAQQSSGGVFQSMALLRLGSGVGELVLSVFFLNGCVQFTFYLASSDDDCRLLECV